ncbi:MAG: hypothetical protein HKO85_11565 [Xanthomonadales bacterium]|nr:hypothetical protein [Gammaproteobacteria bacterium]MBT8056895.1 hypothetical protein [Gammaproteobacteria bacterium]NNL05915.1 hypothetical protein [Xanthomonadales bacterium]
MVNALVLALTTALPAFAQATESPYTSIQGREIKALSQERVDSYVEGHGMGLALAAELNGYPGPKHVLELQQDLDLSGDQKTATKAIFTEMNMAAKALGAEIVALELELDRLFSSRAMDDETLRVKTGRIAQLEGKLRAAHLLAHLKMMNVLRTEQVERYSQLRGYGSGEHHGNHHSMKHHQKN